MNNDETGVDIVTELTNQAGDLAAKGELEKASEIYLKALEMEPLNPEVLHSLGLLKYQMGFQSESIEYLRKAIKINPVNHYYHNNIAIIYSGAGSIPQALEAFQKALELCPDNPNYHFNTGALYYTLGDYESAIHYYKNALLHKPDYFEAYNNLGKALQEHGKIKDAADAYRNAIKINPGYSFAHNNLGTILQDKGDFEGAMAAYESAANLDPDFAMPLSNIAYLKKCTSTQDKIFARIIELFENDNLSAADEILLSFALGKLFDDCHEYDKAFHNYDRGNLLAGLNCTFDAGEHEKYLDKLKNTFNKKYFKNLSEPGSESSLPVFIIGMPRSGTSLIEQIIASHSAAFGAGELDFFNQITGIMTLNQKVVTDRIEFWSRPDKGERVRAATAYLDLLTSCAGNQNIHVVDKMPYNFLHLGLISSLFPGAPVIHCRREPLDTCLSIYFHYFQGFHNYSYDLNNIARYYKGYDNLMSHWESLIPNPYMTVNYEDLINNIEIGSRSIMEFLNLPWEEACLKFYENKQVVRTRSNIQVRQPVYTTSINRWENYSKHIKPLLDAFAG